MAARDKQKGYLETKLHIAKLINWLDKIRSYRRGLVHMFALVARQCRLILMHLARGLSSKLIIPPSVRPCVPLLGEAQNLCFCTILSEISENHLCILRYLATVALKT